MLLKVVFMKKAVALAHYRTGLALVKLHVFVSVLVVKLCTTIVVSALLGRSHYTTIFNQGSNSTLYIFWDSLLQFRRYGRCLFFDYIPLLSLRIC